MSNDTYQMIEGVLDRLVDRPDPPPSLEDLADSVGLSAPHFQRLFKRWVGVSPKKFMQYLTLDHARQCLDQQASVLDASLDAGLSGPGRLHDLMVSLVAMTPGEYKQGGRGLDITWGQVDSPFGPCTLFMTRRGLCGLEFGPGAYALERVQQRWPQATYHENPQALASVAGKAFNTDLAGQVQPLSLLVQGSDFQLKVWEALLSIPPGDVTSYGDIARQLQMARGGARTVGAAIASNPVGWLIPCHRVIQQSGALSGYRWGPPRKLAMQGWEAVKREHAAP